MYPSDFKNAGLYHLTEWVRRKFFSNDEDPQTKTQSVSENSTNSNASKQPKKSKATLNNSPKPRKIKVFLCHSSYDKNSVRNLYQRLCKDGIVAWFDEENILPGQDWNHEIIKAVRDSHIVIVCLSQNSIGKSGYVHKEIKQALDVADEQPENTIFIIPLKLEECEIPERLRRWQWVNYFEERGYNRLMKALELRENSLNL